MSWIRWLQAVLVAILLATLIVQMAVPLRLVAADLSSESQEFEEESEPAEESETDGEQGLFAFTGPQTTRARQPGGRFMGSSLAAKGPRSAARGPLASDLNDLRRRNGIGGPLRC